MLASIISIDRQTHEYIVEMASEDFHFFTRNEPLHLLDVLCEWRRRWITFFETSYSERECFHGSISIQFLLSMGTILVKSHQDLFFVVLFLFVSDRPTKSFALSFNAYFSSWSRICFVVVQIHHKPFWSTRNDQKVTVVPIQRPNSDLHSMFTVQITGCNFRYGPNFGVPLDLSFRLWCWIFSRKSVFTTSHCI